MNGVLGSCQSPETDGLLQDTMEEGPSQPLLCSPSSKCLSSSICLPHPPSTLDGKDPGMGEAGSCLPMRIPVNLAQGAGALWDGKCWGEEGRPLCAPRAPTYPAIGFPRERPASRPTPPLPGAAMEPPASSISALATLDPPAGSRSSPIPHCPSPSPDHPVAT